MDALLGAKLTQQAGFTGGLWAEVTVASGWLLSGAAR